LIGAHYVAEANYKIALAATKKVANQRLIAQINNQLGNSYLINNKPKIAIAAFKISYKLFGLLKQSTGQLAAGINLLRASINVVPADEIAVLARDVHNLMLATAVTQIRIDQILALSDLYRTIQRQYSLEPEMRSLSFTLAQQALTRAKNKRDTVSQSYALGYLGRLLEDEARWEDALSFTRQAIFKSQEVSAFDSLYQWQWQQARIQNAQGQQDNSVASYKASIDTLDKIQSLLILHKPKAFSTKVGPVYYELTDILLRRSSQLKDPAQISNNLADIRSILEKLKVSEIEDYFKNDCLLDQQNNSVESYSSDGAIIYPIILKERLELLVSLPEGLRQYTVPVTKAEIVSAVRELRLAIEQPSAKDNYHASAKLLHDWLVTPYKQDLQTQKVKTLVFIPDGALRSIPMSVLHDGKQHLIEQFALATTPGLSFTSNERTDRSEMKLLANGLTDAVQGFNELPFVKNEINAIDALMASKSYIDAEFSKLNVEREMIQGDYNIVHVATHGQFSQNHNESFLLTHTEKLTMDNLEDTIGLRKYVNKPLDLLVLSACQSAAGDDRAALGLAGVAIKAGAKSAIATLWFINDKATSILMTDFYTNLTTTDNSKAEALQNAQLKLINSQRYTHPAYWAPFLMIGNWL